MILLFKTFKAKVNKTATKGDKSMKRTANPYEGPILLSNNARRMHGLPTHRKTDRRKRFFTRCEATETVEAFLNFCDNTTLYYIPKYTPTK